MTVEFQDEGTLLLLFILLVLRFLRFCVKSKCRKWGLVHQDSFLDFRHAHLGDFRGRDALVWCCVAGDMGDEESDGDGDADCD